MEVLIDLDMQDSVNTNNINIESVEQVRSAVNKDKKYLLYMHAGSGNHGCEAIVNSLCNLLKSDDTDITLVSNDKAEDERYSIGKLCNIVQEQKMDEHFVTHALYYIYRKITGDRESFLNYRYKNAGKYSDYDLAISIGGDNYCYNIMVDDLVLANRMFNNKNVKTVLLGCSIEPELLKNPRIVEDMKRYSLIISRESITTKALKDAGVDHVVQLPDPAFALEPIYRELPKNFVEGNTVGINVSPMILDYEAEGSKGIIWNNYVELMRYVLEDTDMNVALVPHVIWARNDDVKPIQKLYDEFKDKYDNRISLVQDGTCQELKGDIARCRFFVGARTHSTIAAYSTGVPTLVAGYSVKSIGIARDLFGTEEGYVVDVRELKTEKELVNSFKEIVARETKIRGALAKQIPDYKAKLAGIKEILTKEL